MSEFMQSANPGDWENVAKAFQNREPSTTNPGLSKWANAAYVGDLPYDFAGLKEAVTRMVAKSPYVAAPYAELTGYSYLDGGIPNEEVYYRRLHFGALQPVMAHTPYANADPWRARVRTRPGEDLPLLGLAPQGARALLLQLRLPNVREPEPAPAAAGPDDRTRCGWGTRSTRRSSPSPPTR